MSQRDVIIFYSKQLNASYVTTNLGYMNKDRAKLISIFNAKHGSSGDGGNANFDDRLNLTSVVDIALASDFQVEIRKNQGESNSQQLKAAKEQALLDYLGNGYTPTNGKRA